VSGVSDFMRGPDGTPRLATRAMADSAGAMFLTMAVLAAIVVRQRTGRGQRVDASLVGACLGMHTAEVTIALDADRVFRPEGRVTSTSGAFRCRDDRWLVIGATDQKLWRALTTALGRDDLFEDERFARSRIRERNRAELEPLLEKIFLERDRDDWVLLMQEHGIPAAPVNTFLDLADDPDALANGYILEQDDRKWGKVKTVGHPFHMALTPATVGDWTPELGEDTESVLLAAGLAPERIAELAESEVVQLAAAPEAAR
jgi:crotonobetainyl-CoA:carnitine CoA-transferase CaiB-like acyl-CoA transferase